MPAVASLRFHVYAEHYACNDEDGKGNRPKG